MEPLDCKLYIEGLIRLPAFVVPSSRVLALVVWATRTMRCAGEVLGSPVAFYSAWHALLSDSLIYADERNLSSTWGMRSYFGAWTPVSYRLRCAGFMVVSMECMRT